MRPNISTTRSTFRSSKTTEACARSKSPRVPLRRPGGSGFPRLDRAPVMACCSGSAGHLWRTLPCTRRQGFRIGHRRCFPQSEDSCVLSGSGRPARWNDEECCGSDRWSNRYRLVGAGGQRCDGLVAPPCGPGREDDGWCPHPDCCRVAAALIPCWGDCMFRYDPARGNRPGILLWVVSASVAHQI